MGDTFCELIVPGKASPADSLKPALLLTGTAAAAVLGLFVHSGAMILLLAFLIADVILLPKLILRKHVEYEYTYVNGSIDIAAVYSKQDRKELLSVDLEKAECVAPRGSAHLGEYGETYREADYSAGDGTNPPYVIVLGGEDKKKILLQLNQEMIDDLRARMPRKVFLS